MSRYRGPRLKILRRLGNLDGLKKDKNSIRKNSPGQHGKDMTKQKIGPYNLRLLEKQKLRFNYGLSETQLLNFVKKARRLKGSTGLKLLQMLEMRLDTIAFRLGWGSSIAAARQLINHGHILVNEKNVNISSFICKPGDKLTLKSKVSKNQQILISSDQYPQFLEVDEAKKTGLIKEIITKKDFTISVDELLIVEYYSRK
uniref:ribosomal protein S4 n=1 Tax=Vacuolaria virescens TaxID=44451 RepID=UPI0021158C99|nr:ribosomal protein S4 [Vacuolaria virescens]UTE94749.1 ribosomal protein S4 [Vacuolaria virescens]